MLCAVMRKILLSSSARSPKLDTDDFPSTGTYICLAPLAKKRKPILDSYGLTSNISVMYIYHSANLLFNTNNTHRVFLKQ